MGELNAQPTSLMAHARTVAPAKAGAQVPRASGNEQDSDTAMKAGLGNARYEAARVLATTPRTVAPAQAGAQLRRASGKPAEPPATTLT